MGNAYVLFALVSLAVGDRIIKKSHLSSSSFGEKYDWVERDWKGLFFRFVQGIIGLAIFIVGLVVFIINVVVAISIL